MTEEQRIEPHRIQHPFQLLAAWLVALTLVDGSFLSGAVLIAQPAWAPAALVVASIANVPVFLVCLFALQTRYRIQMQDDSYYAGYVREQQRLRELTLRLDKTLNTSGLDAVAIATGRTVNDIDPQAMVQIRELAANLSRTTPSTSTERCGAEARTPETYMALARASMADAAWIDAAHYLDRYVETIPDDWQAQFIRGVAHANSRLGTNSNLAALRAYNEAIALVPRNLNKETLATAIVYRSAMYRRLGRLAQAEADLMLASQLADSPSMRAEVLYNQACIHAMVGRRGEAIATVAMLRELPQMAAVRGHLHDYFASLTSDPEFQRLLRYGASTEDTHLHRPLAHPMDGSRRL